MMDDGRLIKTKPWKIWKGVASYRYIVAEPGGQGLDKGKKVFISFCVEFNAIVDLH